MSPIPNVGDRTAPQLYGFLFNYGLMGALLVQVYQFYVSFPKDRKITKTIVYAMFILELAQTTVMSYFAYTIFGSGYGDLDVFDKSALEWFPVCVLGSLVAGIAQLFYAHRIFIVSKSRIWGLVIVILALLQVGSGVAQGVISKLLTDRSKLSSNFVCLTIWLVDTAVCDVAIAVSMVYHLRRKDYLTANTNDVISRMARYTVETGLITAITAVIQITIQLTLPAKNYFETPSWALGKLYSNCLLFLLNSRAVVKGGRHDSTLTQSYVNEVELQTGGPMQFAPGPLNKRESKAGELNHHQLSSSVAVNEEESSNFESNASFPIQSN